MYVNNWGIMFIIICCDRNFVLFQNKECNVKLGELQSKVDKDAQTAEQNKQYFSNLKADLDKEKETRIKLELETEELKKKIAEEQGKNKTNDNSKQHLKPW